MFAYCLNNPIIYRDSCGTRAVLAYDAEMSDGKRRETSTATPTPPTPSKNDPVKEAIDHIQAVNEAQRQLQNEITRQQTELLMNGVKAGWNAWQRGYDIQQESMMLQAKYTLDMFDSPEDIERSIDIIGASYGFSMAIYEVAIAITASDPVAGAIGWALIGAAWSVRALIREFQ